MPPYGACLLGSINLAKLVQNPFDDAAAIDEAALADHEFLSNLLAVGDAVGSFVDGMRQR